MKSTEEIKKMLDFDPLSHAEKITGKDWKESEETSMLGLAIALQHNREKEQMLKEIDDTGFSNNTIDYLRIVQNFGFEIVLNEVFFDNVHYQRNQNLYVLFHKELGILITFDTFGENVNGGEMYYNWSPNGYLETNGCTSSGGYFFPNKNGHIGLVGANNEIYTIDGYPDSLRYDYQNETWEQFEERSAPIEMEQKKLINEAISKGYRIVWIGNHDCREAIITNIKRMQQFGKFLPIWVQQPLTLWITHFAEKMADYEEYDKISKQRIAKLPDYVRKQIFA